MVEICYLVFRIDPSLDPRLLIDCPGPPAGPVGGSRSGRREGVPEVQPKYRHWPGTEVAVRSLYGPLSLPTGGYAKRGSDRGLGLI